MFGHLGGVVFFAYLEHILKLLFDPLQNIMADYLAVRLTISKEQQISKTTTEKYYLRKIIF